MYPTKAGLLIGFHGCDKSVRDEIVKGKVSLNPSENLYDWLGNGIYFWENNQQRAFEFANELKKSARGNIKKPSVLGAVIDLGYCLDLLDTEYLKLVSESHSNLNDSFESIELSMPVNKTVGGSKDLLLRNLDRAVIENLHQQRNLKNLTSFDSVRGVFIEGKPLYDGAGFHEKNHIQICIRNPNCIKGFFVPRTADGRFRMP
jgi:hypothetical protein